MRSQKATSSWMQSECQRANRAMSAVLMKACLDSTRLNNVGYLTNCQVGYILLTILIEGFVEYSDVENLPHLSHKD